MTAPPGSGFKEVSKNTTDLFKRWFSVRAGGLRAMWDLVLPVVVVDRFRDDDEGSLWGMTAFTPGNVNEPPACAFGSGVNDWELMAISAAVLMPAGSPASADFEHHVFTPVAPYNPVSNLNPVGFYQPGLITNRSFTLGTVAGVAGSTPLIPTLLGFEINPPVRLNIIAPPNWLTLVPGFRGSLQTFEPPLRIFRDVTLAFQVLQPVLFGAPVGLIVSIMYRERPKS